MELFSGASMLAIAGKLVTTEVTKAAISGAKSQLQPDKMALVLKQSIEYTPQFRKGCRNALSFQNKIKLS